MALVRMDLQTLVVGNPGSTSLMVLKPHNTRNHANVKLPIRIGYPEAAAIGMGSRPNRGHRPRTHDLLLDVVQALDATLTGISIVDVRGTTFYAQLRLLKPTGEQVLVDARPSDAVALALRTRTPIYADEAVLDTAATPDFQAVEEQEKRDEMAQFHDFVEHLSPDDFTASSQDSPNSDAPHGDTSSGH